MASHQQGESAKAAPELELSRAKRNFRLRALSRAVAEPSQTVATLAVINGNGPDNHPSLIIYNLPEDDGTSWKDRLRTGDIVVSTVGEWV